MLWKEGWALPLCEPRWELIPAPARFALERLEERGFEAALVGGCVRDMLLYGEPRGDLDVTTSALPEEVFSAFPEHRVLPTGVQHGTVTLVVDHCPIEITTFRRDGDYSDLRRPDSVSFTRSLAEDVARRDFTMNAVAWERGAGLIDHVGGLDDLARGRIRAVGEARRRFSEDALRVIRALRFHAQLAGEFPLFAIEPETAAAVRALYPNLRRIAAERVWKELGKLVRGSCAPVLRAYPEVFRLLLPALGALSEEAYGRSAARMELLGGESASPRPWAALLYEAGAEAAAETLRGLRADRRTVAETRLCVSLAARVRPDLAALRRLAGEAMLFLERENGAPSRGAALLLLGDAARIALAFSEGERDAILRLLRRIGDEGLPCAPADLAVSGGDLAALGLRGPAVGAAQRALLDEVLSGALPNERQALLERARALCPRE